MFLLPKTVQRYKFFRFLSNKKCKLRAEVFLNVSRCFPNREHKFYCPQLWVVRPTVMGCITHSYGLYNSQLWVIKLVSIKEKTSAHVLENIC